MKERVAAYIRQHNLLKDGGRVLVGLSGGADSVVLLRLLHSMGYECVAAHCNFHLRGKESMRDEEFVENLCAKMGVRLAVVNFATGEYAKQHGLSIEMAAREMRYEWFETQRQTYDCEAIAVAHHQNDQAETLLLNLSRGTGIRGLCGMHPRNGHVIRPLLCLSRKEIEMVAEEEHWDYVTDSTNADTTIKRNGFRSMLSSASEQEIRHMAETASLMQAYKTLLDALINGQSVEDDAEMALLYELLAPYGLNATQIENILHALPTSGKRFEAADYVATINHGQLTIKAKQHEEAKKPMLLRAIRPRWANERFPKADEMRVLLDADQLHDPLTLRHWKAGDIFYPISARKAGRKKVQDFFTDQKLSIEDKEQVWLLCEGEEERIVWIIGHRIDDRYKITDKTTRVAEIEVEEQI